MIFTSTMLPALLTTFGLCVSMTTVDAHTYVTISRGRKCQQGLNRDCGQISYEPQSLEYTKGYPTSGPPDGRLGSAGHPRAPGTGGTPNLDFTPLNVQTSSRWHKTPATAGSSISFTWVYTAVHRSNGYRYFITRPGWNQNASLTRSSFDSTPFCSSPGNGSLPPSQVTNTCTIPSDRTGYHIVMAIWEVADTSEAFYNMIDLQLSGGSTGGGGSSGGGGSLGDWITCSTSSQCANSCCSGKYSNGVLKCTPLSSGFNPAENGCVAGSTTLLGDWSTCSASSQCANRCCSGMYSNGVLKCTPLSSGFNPSTNGCVGGRRNLRGNDEDAPVN
ncbi:hypothetical protein ACA910_021261 [Epithemia clementina (nom. ined.)]